MLTIICRWVSICTNQLENTFDTLDWEFKAHANSPTNRYLEIIKTPLKGDAKQINQTAISFFKDTKWKISKKDGMWQ